MLSEFLSALGADESVTVNLSKDGKENPRLVLQAKVDFDPDEQDESVRTLRAALARPLVLRLDKSEDADDAIKAAIKGFCVEQRSSRDALADYKADQVATRASVKAASSKAKSDNKEPAASEKGASEQETDASAESSNPAPAPEADPAANPSSLF
jgi:hypothetical protein